MYTLTATKKGHTKTKRLKVWRQVKLWRTRFENDGYAVHVEEEKGVWVLKPKPIHLVEVPLSPDVDQAKRNRVFELLSEGARIEGDTLVLGGTVYVGYSRWFGKEF